MMFPQIRSIYHAFSQNSNVFYILSKGNNAGKPSLKPWANSFVVVCANKQYVDFYFWLVNALFITGKFKVRLRGTAIPFVNINDIRDLLKEVAPVAFAEWAQFQELIKVLDKLQQLKTNLSEQVAASESLQKYLLQNYFKAG